MFFSAVSCSKYFDVTNRVLLGPYNISITVNFICKFLGSLVVAVAVKNTVFCNVTPCSLIDVTEASEDYGACIFRVEESFSTQIIESAYFLKI
jgi:hypothetical protein